MPEAQKPLRVFCAVELPDGLRSRVAERARRLRAEFLDARASWEKPEKLHLTLKFLGDVEPARVEALSGAAARAAAGVEPFELIIDAPGAFPPRGQPRVLWLGVVDASERLGLMRSALETECAAAGFPRESRAFKPHLTLARVRSPRGAR
ncbi:MAG TPA: RNA 2',3'-cyclic phosphodiesterase, partial [Pyrinomonadaceae bacterium]|nr:RNA 2',3'-cyclic phosphodiesterase [Pyrinomonadaceae bacterium]